MGHMLKGVVWLKSSIWLAGGGDKKEMNFHYRVKAFFGKYNNKLWPSITPKRNGVAVLAVEVKRHWYKWLRSTKGHTKKSFAFTDHTLDGKWVWYIALYMHHLSYGWDPCLDTACLDEQWRIKQITAFLLISTLEYSKSWVLFYIIPCRFSVTSLIRLIINLGSRKII